MRVRVHMHVRECVRACVRACVRTCVRVCERSISLLAKQCISALTHSLCSPANLKAEMFFLPGKEKWT